MRDFFFRGVVDSKGNIKGSIRFTEKVVLTVDQNGKLVVEGGAGAFFGKYAVGRGLESLGLKVPGASIILSNFESNSFTWKISVPAKNFFGFDTSISYGGTISLTPEDVRDWMLDQSPNIPSRRDRIACSIGDKPASEC